MNNAEQRPRFVAVVLAAGQGTRMKSARPKVLHEVAGRALVGWAIDTALAAGAERVVTVVGHGREAVERYLRSRYEADKVVTQVQPEQRGTGHAVRCALPALADWKESVTILYGDCPLIPAHALDALHRARHRHPLGLLVATLDQPTGYGRVLRDRDGCVVGIREEKDASEAEKDVREVNPGVYSIDLGFLRRALDDLSSDNAAGELYLTDLAAIAAKGDGVADVAWPMDDLRGINDRSELADADARMQERLITEHARRGATFRCPASTWVGADVTLAEDVTIESHVVLRGRTQVGRGTRIDVGCVLDDVEVGVNAWLKPYTVAHASRVGEDAQVGPFAHLRPRSNLGPETRIGNFVETKNTQLGRGSKANHLAYLGDGVIGEQVNVGAGTIFCNYDGVQKHTTVIEDEAFVGSDTQLVAPVTIGKGAYVATGTTVTHDVPDDALAVGRARQSNKEGYASRLRARMKAAKQASQSKEDD